MDSHSSFCPSKRKTPPVYAGGFSLNQVKLTDKPLSFGYSVVDSHSSFCPSKSKNPPKRVFT
ncbi:hypothetical protein ACN87_11530 [Escherichia coli]|nr:hypothetical protein ACN87_11530 [Escherichia coli]